MSPMVPAIPVAGAGCALPASGCGADCCEESAGCSAWWRSPGGAPRCPGRPVWGSTGSDDAGTGRCRGGCRRVPSRISLKPVHTENEGPSRSRARFSVRTGSRPVRCAPARRRWQAISPGAPGRPLSAGVVRIRGLWYKARCTNSVRPGGPLRSKLSRHGLKSSFSLGPHARFGQPWTAPGERPDGPATEQDSRLAVVPARSGPVSSGIRIFRNTPNRRCPDGSHEMTAQRISRMRSD